MDRKDAIFYRGNVKGYRIMLKDTDLCHLQEIYLANIEDNYWIQE